MDRSQTGQRSSEKASARPAQRPWQVGDREDRFFATAFLGSGLLFLPMLLAAAALAGSLVASSHQDTALAANGTWEVARRASNTLMHVYAMRMAAVFMISTSTILSRGGLAPRILALTGYVIAFVLLILAPAIPWVDVLFPAWAFLVSLHILQRGHLHAPNTAATGKSPACRGFFYAPLGRVDRALRTVGGRPADGRRAAALASCHSLHQSAHL